MRKLIFVALGACLSSTGVLAQRQWTLQECIDYALENNIQLKQSRLTNAQNELDVKQSKAALFPTLSFSTNQNGSWRPFSESTVNLSNGTMTTTRNTTTYNGSAWTMNTSASTGAAAANDGKLYNDETLGTVTFTGKCQRAVKGHFIHTGIRISVPDEQGCVIGSDSV